MDGNSVEVKDGWVSVEVNCHLTDLTENTARPKRWRGCYGSEEIDLERNFPKLPIETDVTHGEQNARR